MLSVCPVRPVRPIGRCVVPVHPSGVGWVRSFFTFRRTYVRTYVGSLLMAMERWTRGCRRTDGERTTELDRSVAIGFVVRSHDRTVDPSINRSIPLSSYICCDRSDRRATERTIKSVGLFVRNGVPSFVRYRQQRARRTDTQRTDRSIDGTNNDRRNRQRECTQWMHERTNERPTDGRTEQRELAEI